MIDSIEPVIFSFSTLITMKTTVKTILLSSIVFSLGLSSCKKDDPDKTAPVIASVSEPLSGDTLLSGGELHVEATITDNEELSQLKVDIHSDADGHSHGKIDASSYWEQVYIFNLTGATQSLHQDIQIPANAAAGAYHVILTAVDKSGNTSAFVERDIYIRNSGDLVAPLITLSAPSSGASITAGTDLTVSGELTDNVGLYKAEVKVYKGSTLVNDTDIDLAAPTHSLNQTISTTGWSTGAYTLEIKVYDEVMNMADLDVEFTVN